MSQNASAVTGAQQSEVQTHQPGQEVFKTILSEDVDWKPFPAFPPSVRWLAAASEKDRAVADMLSSYWTNFAKTGDPNGKGLPEWAIFKTPDLRPHILGEINDYPGADVLSMYDEQYKKILTTLTSTSAQK
jgi:hypothetical protein